MCVRSLLLLLLLSADFAAYGYTREKLIIIDKLGLSLKIRHGATIDNVVTNLYAKFDDDRL